MTSSFSLRCAGIALLAAFVLCASWYEPSLASAAPSNKVLILAGTVTGGASSIEADEAKAQGLSVEVVSGSTWDTMTPAQFASYRAIILGDPTCQGLGTDQQAAANNATSWGPQVTGNIVILGTDPVFHASQGGEAVTRRGVDFALAQSGKTGAYITLSCYYHGTAPNTPVPLLRGIGSGNFTVTGVGCYNNAHIVAVSPALTGITDATLSNWSCSVHEAFLSWPGSLVPLAIAKDFSSSYTASDGTTGPPYILAGGNIKSFPLSITPLAGSADAGGSQTVTAQLLDGSTRAPVAGARIGFSVIGGPNKGANGSCSPSTCTTDANGNVSFTYHSCGSTGDDTIQAYYDQNGNGKADLGEPQTTAGMTWKPLAASLGHTWPHSCGATLQLGYTYGGTHKYLGNASQGASNWSNAGAKVRIGPTPSGGSPDVVLADNGSFHTWWALTTTAWSGCCQIARPVTTIYNSNGVAGFLGWGMEGLSDFMRTKVATHEFGHSFGLAHPEEFGIGTGTKSVMHQGNLTYNTPQAFDTSLVSKMYP